MSAATSALTQKKTVRMRLQLSAVRFQKYGKELAGITVIGGRHEVNVQIHYGVVSKTNKTTEQSTLPKC